ncbi:hypothetical protein [Nitrosopumilus ureiphilus]|nr:hypothetical protein [Nitrosopumilus ureiphilus]
MNGKTKYMIPAFAAVFALMFAFTPFVMAEEDGEYTNEKHAKWGGEKHFKKGNHGKKAILVEGFTGSIQVPEEMTRETHSELKDQVTVSLSQAVSVAEDNGVTDAMKASIGIVKDAEGNKYVVWTITSIDKDTESETITKNIFVVDAGDAVNFTTITKSFDHSEMKERMHGDKTAKFEKFQQKFSEPTGDAEVDAARAQFLDLMQQLRDAYENGDTETAQSIKDQLHELKSSFLNMRNPHF